MAQASYDIQGTDGVKNTLKTVIDSFFEAVLTKNSGNTEPLVKKSFMWWADTTTGLLKRRNAANDNWLIIARLADVGGLRTNAGNPNGALTGLYQGERLFDTTNNIDYSYSGSGTIWIAQQSASSPALALPPNYHDARITFKNASTVTIKAGSRFRSSDNSEDIVFAIDFDVSLAAAGNGGLDAGSEASNTWYYLYVIKNPVSGASGAVLSTVNESVTGSITYPSGFTKKRQVRFASRNDASSNILPFVYRPSDAQIIYRDFEIDVSGSGIASGFSALNAGTATSWTAVSLGTFAPPASQRVVMSLSMWGDGGLVDRRFKIRPTGSGLSTGVLSISGASQFPSLSNPWVETPCSASQQIDYIGLGLNGALSFAVRGYYITEIS